MRAPAPTLKGFEKYIILVKTVFSYVRPFSKEKSYVPIALDAREREVLKKSPARTN